MDCTIDGVSIRTLQSIPDERGRLMEILRRDDDHFQGFGQVYLTTVLPGVVKAWHMHRHQVDVFTAIKGMLKAVLVDQREESPTAGTIMEIFMGEHRPLQVVVPPGIYHGYKCISVGEALIINVPNRVYNYADPDEVRLPPHAGHFDYDWARVDR